MPQFLSITEFMSAARISRPTVYRKIKTGEIPFTRIGYRILIPALFLKELEDKAMRSVKTG
jgi:excisionase family DNA binding protein